MRDGAFQTISMDQGGAGPEEGRIKPPGCMGCPQTGHRKTGLGAADGEVEDSQLGLVSAVEPN